MAMVELESYYKFTTLVLTSQHAKEGWKEEGQGHRGELRLGGFAQNVDHLGRRESCHRG